MERTVIHTGGVGSAALVVDAGALLVEGMVIALSDVEGIASGIDGATGVDGMGSGVLSISARPLVAAFSSVTRGPLSTGRMVDG